VAGEVGSRSGFISSYDDLQFWAQPLLIQVKMLFGLSVAHPQRVLFGSRSGRTASQSTEFSFGIDVTQLNAEVRKRHTHALSNQRKAR